MVRTSKTAAAAVVVPAVPTQSGGDAGLPEAATGAAAVGQAAVAQAAVAQQQVPPVVASAPPAAATVKKQRRGRKANPAEAVAVVAEYRVAHAEPPKATPQHVILRIKPGARDAAADEVSAYDAVKSNAFASEPMHIAQAEGSARHVDAVLQNVVHEGGMAPSGVAEGGGAPLAAADLPRGSSGSSVCFWCCHPLHSHTYGMPVRSKDSKYHVCGCFCSFECAAAFNLNSNELCQNTWVTSDLLNRMAREAGYTRVVQPAPSRYALQMFGGWLTIDDFRRHEKTINPLPFHMLSLQQYMDQVMSSEMHSCLPSQQTVPAFVPLDQERVKQAKQNLMASSKGQKSRIHDRMGLTVGASGASGAAL